VSFQNGAVATTFSSEEPERLRGPQHDLLWFDELAAFKNARAVWDTAMLGLRLGARPRAIVTTTPAPVPLIRDLLKREGEDVAVTRSRTADNAHNLAPSFLSAIAGRYLGSRLGRQELDGELLEDAENALWSRDLIEACRIDKADLPPMRRIVVAIDPSVGTGKDADECGLIVAGLSTGGEAFILQDASGRMSPVDWARKAVALYREHGADRVIAESNQGGAMVETTLRTIDGNVSLRLVNASRGKIARAEPVSSLFEQKRAHFVGTFPELEDELCTFTAGSSSSPNRLDAMVWACTELLLSSSSADCWIDWYRQLAQRAQIAVPSASPAALKADPLPWRPGSPARSAATGNDLTRRYFEIRAEFSRLIDARPLAAPSSAFNVIGRETITYPSRALDDRASAARAHVGPAVVERRIYELFAAYDGAFGIEEIARAAFLEPGQSQTRAQRLSAIPGVRADYTARTSSGLPPEGKESSSGYERDAGDVPQARRGAQSPARRARHEGEAAKGAGVRAQRGAARLAPKPRGGPAKAVRRAPTISIRELAKGRPSCCRETAPNRSFPTSDDRTINATRSPPPSRRKGAASALRAAIWALERLSCVGASSKKQRDKDPVPHGQYSRAEYEPQPPNIPICTRTCLAWLYPL
jgi:phage terminase large subunit-like protein